MLKILITFPPITKNGKFPQITQNRFFKWMGASNVCIMPIIPSYAATLLKLNGFKVRFLDAIAEKMNWAQFRKEIEIQAPDLVAMEVKTPVIKAYWKIVDKLKELNNRTKIALMGDHVTIFPEESLNKSKADYIVRGGDFDVGLAQLALHLRDGQVIPKGIMYKENGIIENASKYELIKNLDTLPFIDRDLIKWKNYKETWRLFDEFSYIMSGRGCSYRCTFCSWPHMLFEGKMRLRSPHNVVEEIKNLHERYHIKEVFDDLGTFPTFRNWILPFCKEMIEEGLNEKVCWSINGRSNLLLDEEIIRKMKKAGLRLVKIGIESSDQRILNKLRKRTTIDEIENSVRLLKKHRVLVHGALMVGYPYFETKDTVKKNLKFLRKLNLDSIQVSIITPYPGTRLYEEAIENDWFVTDSRDWNHFDMSVPVLKSPSMSSKEIVKACKDIWKGFYFNFNTILGQLKKMRSFDHLKLSLRGAWTVLSGHVRGFNDD